MKKEMKKAEILERLTKLKTELDKTPEQYCKDWNDRHPNNRTLKEEDYWPFMVGTVGAEIDWILEGGF